MPSLYQALSAPSKVGVDDIMVRTASGLDLSQPNSVCRQPLTFRRINGCKLVQAISQRIPSASFERTMGNQLNLTNSEYYNLDQMTSYDGMCGDPSSWQNHNSILLAGLHQSISQAKGTSLSPVKKSMVPLVKHDVNHIQCLYYARRHH
jgi:hypothetical protein